MGRACQWHLNATGKLAPEAGSWTPPLHMFLERWPSGLRRRIANPLYGLIPVPRVQIPPFPILKPQWRDLKPTRPPP